MKEDIKGRECSDLEAAVDILGSLVNFAMRNGCTFTDALKIYEAGGEEYRLRAERLALKCIRALILEVTSQEDSVQANPNMLKQLRQWNIEI